MSDNVYIQKSNPLSPAEDFDAMRSDGFKLIEQLSHDIWTNYNNSDPGITILDAVIYAITDLAYRTGFEIKDLLAPENLTDETWKEIFYTARLILHNNPLTIDDYRKLIIDIEGVRNAWLEPSREYEVPVWVNYNYYELRETPDCSCTEPEETFCMGRLGLNAANQQDSDNFWNQKTEENQKNSQGVTDDINNLNTKISAIQNQISNEQDPVALEELKKNLADFQNQLNNKLNQQKEFKKEAELISKYKNFKPSKIVEFEGLYNVMVEYEEDIIDENKREEIRQTVVHRLLRHRNLCEDFLTVNGVNYEDVGIATSIELEEYADPDIVLSQIFFILYKYFTPSIPFYTIEQMLAKSYQIDEIFEGPALKHGFIDTADLEKTGLYRDLRLSDIIGEVMDINGVKAITWLHLPFNGFNNSTGENFFQEWVYTLKNERKIARIQPSQSVIIFCKERETITYNVGSGKDRRPNRMLKLFSDLKTSERKYKLQNVALDLPIPRGENMALKDYYPVTYSLPMTYGVSELAGLPASSSEERKIQALQLKGYLLFFEQILFDYLVQLDHLRNIFTMDASPEHTYFTGVLTQLQDLKSLLIDVNNHGNDFNAILSEFASFVQDLAEPHAQFLQRRNIFLNHFLARFSEDVSNYEAIVRLIMPNVADEKLITDKTNILKSKEYKEISSDRGKAFNYAAPKFWDTKNISGAEWRISRLLGFEKIKRRYLAPDFITVVPVMISDKNNQLVQKTNIQGKPLNSIKITDPDNKQSVLFTSVEVMGGCCSEQLINDILTNADIPANLIIQDNLNRRARKTVGILGSFWFEIYDGPDLQTSVLLGESQHFDKIDDRNNALERFKKVMLLIDQNEGLHLVEHILLRPRLDEVFDEAGKPIPVSFPDICLQPCDLSIGVDEGEVPQFKKKITRTPAEKCYDNMPWILEYLDANNHSFFFQTVTVREDLSTAQTPLKFRRYADLSQRIQDLAEFGSERTNYTIVSNNADQSSNLKYGFIIYNDKGVVLAQSLFIYNKRTKEQIANGTAIDNGIETMIVDLIAWFGNEMDWYCDPNPCDNNEDPFSFRTTVVLPCWPKRFRAPTFKNLAEKTIATESPAHVHTRIIWLGMSEMRRFEQAYYNWLQEMSLTEIPSYEKVNPLVDVLNSLQPCGTCKDDCQGNTTVNPGSNAGDKT